eukprot:2728032-Rhodomonas_salina.2
MIFQIQTLAIAGRVRRLPPSRGSSRACACSLSSLIARRCTGWRARRAARRQPDALQRPQLGLFLSSFPSPPPSASSLCFSSPLLPGSVPQRACSAPLLRLHVWQANFHLFNIYGSDSSNSSSARRAGEGQQSACDAHVGCARRRRKADS